MQDYLAQRQYAPPSSDWVEEVQEVAFDCRWAVGSERLDNAGLAVGSDEYYQVFSSAKADEGMGQTTVLRDVIGNPFRPVTAEPSWLTPTVVSVAEGIYDERNFDQLPILADALQDAGCENADILAHLRDPNATHVRGCWVLDLILGKS